LDICRRTYSRFLETHNIKKWLAKKRPALTDDLAADRLAWAKIHVEWTSAEWAKIWFSDEALIELSRGKKRVWVFRTPIQKWDKNMIDPSAKGKQLSVMIWGAINLLDCKLELALMERDPESPKGGYSANSYIQILDEFLTPAYFPGYIYQQDNARIHTAKKTQNWLENHGIWTIGWPAYSPDLNPIEHVWAKLKEILYERHPHLLYMKGKEEKDIAYLFECILDAWKAMPSDYIYSCIGSMEERCKAVIKAEGWYTKY
jgi:hypothetical protein